jgi:hypothetical protein
MSLFALKEAPDSSKHQQNAQCHDLKEHDLNYYYHKNLSLIQTYMYHAPSACFTPQLCSSKSACQSRVISFLLGFYTA